MKNAKSSAAGRKSIFKNFTIGNLKFEICNEGLNATLRHF